MTKPFTYEQAWAIHKYGEAMAEIGQEMTLLRYGSGSVEHVAAAQDEAMAWWLMIQESFDAHWPSISEQLEGTGIEPEVYYGD